MATDPTSTPSASLTDACKFLHTLFGHLDKVSFRPIETWTEDGTKRSFVNYTHQEVVLGTKQSVYRKMDSLITASEKDLFNVFFGVCPRVGPKHELAWQIRTARTLWADVDNISDFDTLTATLEKAGLPTPSIIVDSGNGFHVYWLLHQPYLIDDAPPAPPVLIEKNEAPKRNRKYFEQDGERIYLDSRRVPLSPKAQLFQNTLSGIAAAIGGDHTTDLSRLLRVPGTFNRKDQRNHKSPRLSRLLQCNAETRYTFAEFEHFAAESPSAQKLAKIAQMPLPPVRKPTAKSRESLDELIAVCRIADVGGRSEADFSMCCYAVRNGIPKDLVWSQVSAIGKFAERGESYFELTWGIAEDEVRTLKFEKIDKPREPKSSKNSPKGDGVAGGDDTNPGVVGDNVIVIDLDTKTSKTLRQITNVVKTRNGYIRAGQLVVIRDRAPRVILSSSELAGMLSEHVDFFFERFESYSPLPSQLGNTWLNNMEEQRLLPKINLFSQNAVYAKNWQLVKPGYDPESGIFYAGDNITPSDSTTHIETMLQDFCFETDNDKTNYIGMLLTSLLMPHFDGLKPMVLFNGNQPGLGKTKLAQIISILRDDVEAETATFNPNDEEFEKRLGTMVRDGYTTIIIDNAKLKGKAKIESACLERSITDRILSFRLIGTSSVIRAENSHIFCLTANHTDVGPDLMSRSIFVNLSHQGDPKGRTFKLPMTPEQYATNHRIEILSELAGMVERWKAAGQPMGAETHRANVWARIVGGILSKSPFKGFLANADATAESLDDERRQFAELVEYMAKSDSAAGRTATELAVLMEKHRLFTHELHNKTDRSKATAIGIIASRFHKAKFDIEIEGETITYRFIRSEDRKSALYYVWRDSESANNEAKPTTGELNFD